MPEIWRATAIEKMAEIFDGPHATPLKTDAGPWFLGISSLRNGRLALSESAHLSEESFQQWTQRVTPQVGDVLFSYETRLGDAALMPDGVTACLGRRMALLRPRREIVHPAFLLYSYLGPKFQALIQRQAVRGATVDRIPLNQMGAWEVDLPVMGTQKAIAGVLASVDVKLDANVVLADAAVGVARTRLNSAAQHKIYRPLSGIANVRKGISYKGSGLAEAGVPMANLANAARFGGFKRDGFKRYTGPYQPRHIARGGDLLVVNTDLTWKLEALGYPMLLPADVPEALFSHHVSIIDFAPEHAYLRLPVWAHLFTRDARLRVESMAHGTTVAAIPPDALTGMDVPVLEPDHPAIGQAEALLQRAWAAERESIALANLRDALLPGLMSGRLKVREAEEAVSEAI